MSDVIGNSTKRLKIVVTTFCTHLDSSFDIYITDNILDGRLANINQKTLNYVVIAVCVTR